MSFFFSRYSSLPSSPRAYLSLSKSIAFFSSGPFLDMNERITKKTKDYGDPHGYPDRHEENVVPIHHLIHVHRIPRILYLKYSRRFDRGMLFLLAL